MNSKRVIQHILLLFILLLAFSIRLAHLAEIRGAMPDTPTFFCGADAATYDGQAQAALIGGWPGDSHFNPAPLYSFYLAFAYRIFGINYLIPLIIQMLLDVVTCAAIYWIGKSIFSPLTGFLAALGVALYGTLISHEMCYFQVALTTPLLVLSFYFLLKFYHSRQAPYLAVSGVMLGLCALSRPTMLVLIPVILIWFLAEEKSFYQFIQKSAWFVIALILVICPITLHNYRATGRIILISDQGPSNFYFGNNPYSTGIGPHGVAGQFAQRVGEVFAFASEFNEVEAKVAAGETTYLKQVIDYISEYPWDWLELTPQKIYLIFLEPDWKLTLTSFVYANSSATFKSSIYLQLLPTEWAALVIASLLALVFGRNRLTFFFWLAILAVSATMMIFFVKVRFRLPLAPFLLLLSFALVTAGRDWFHRDPRKFVIVLLILLALYPFVPSLLLFIVLYAIISLFPYQDSRFLWPLRWPIVAGWSYVVVVSFALQMFALHRSNAQIQNNFTGPEIWGPVMIGQTFSPNCDGLHQIEVQLSRSSFRHDQPYYFHLVRDLNLTDEIYSTQFAVDDVGRWTRKKFSFPPQPHSQQQTYFFYIHSPNSHLGNSVTVRLNPDLPTIYGRYPHGSIYAGNGAGLQPFPADLTFVAYCQESLDRLFARTTQALAASGPGFLGYPAVYAAIFFLHVLLLIVSLLKIGLNIIKR